MNKKTTHPLYHLHGADGGAAGAVVAHTELLNRNIRPASQLPHKETAHAIGGVALVVVGLDHHAGVHRGAVQALVLGGVVGVHRVGHVHGEDERSKGRSCC